LERGERGGHNQVVVGLLGLGNSASMQPNVVGMLREPEVSEENIP
jgi:hypothetical protein